MDPLDAVSVDAAELLRVGLSEWVRHEAGTRATEAEERHGAERVASRGARLRLIHGDKARLHEIDAAIELLEVSDVSPDLVRDLRELRRAVVKGCPVLGGGSVPGA